MKTTKKETIRIIRDILSGRSGHDSVRIRPLRRGYDIYTSCGIGYYDCEPGEFVLRPSCADIAVYRNYQYDRNECTLLEAKEILESLENMC